MASSSNRIVVVAVDASDNAKEAFNWYLKEIHQPKDYVVICHVPEIESASLPTFSFKHGLSPPVEEWQKAITELNNKVKKIEDFYDNELHSKKIAHKIRVEQSRNAGQGIVALSESEKAAFIVIGTRGLDAVRRTFLGSVSDYVIHHSRVPVIVCPVAAPAVSQ